MMRRLVALAVVCAVAGSCTLQTATAPTGDLTLVATFDDAQGLTIGHNVQVANVIVGSIRKIELDGYRARVTMSIVNGRDIPEGTTAVLKRTSLLGEHFVDLVFPETFDVANGPFLDDDTEITATDEQPDFEQLAEQAAEVVGAITADDIASVIEAGSQGIGGRGATLNQVISQLSEISGVLAAQRGNLASAVDGLGQLGASLAPGSAQIGTLVDDLAVASQTIAANRERIVNTLEDLTRLATIANDTILEPHAERLRNLIQQADPILQVLVGSRDTLEALIGNLLAFSEDIDEAVREDQLLLLVWLFFPQLGGLTTASVSDPVETILNLGPVPVRETVQP